MGNNSEIARINIVCIIYLYLDLVNKSALLVIRFPSDAFSFEYFNMYIMWKDIA